MDSGGDLAPAEVEEDWRRAGVERIAARQRGLAGSGAALTSSTGAQDTFASTHSRTRRVRRRRRCASRTVARTVCALLAVNIPAAMAQNCLSLASSTACPGFHSASVSTDSTMIGLFPFLSSVTDTSSFDSGLSSYISGTFSQLRYKTLIGCSAFNADNTTDFYARYTASVLCNAIVQNSITPCGLSGNATRPLCADSCAIYAESEQEISASNVCGTSSANALTQIRADFTDCALPADSLSETCISAATNQPDNCGYGSNKGGLCSYCAASSPNNTDSCCVFSNTTSICQGVVLPIVASSSLQPITRGASSTSSTSISTSTPKSTAAAASRGLTGGQIAGIAVGAVLGALVLLGLIIGACLLVRRRRDSSPATSVFNQPATSRQQPMSFHDGTHETERAGLAVLPGGRVARMTALEGSSGSERHPTGGTAAAAYDKSSSEDSPDSHDTMAPPSKPFKRSGSLSSGSQLAVFNSAVGGFETSPSTNAEYTSPDSNAQSEQLAFFKDYYSTDEIQSGDLVATLWAYEPRAADEFHLERGDMIKVLGIWDDGWATGVRVRMRAEEWSEPGTRAGQRDSGLSTGSESQSRPETEEVVKAFPLVCVCVPSVWRKTVEGESTEGSGPGGPF